MKSTIMSTHKVMLIVTFEFYVGFKKEWQGGNGFIHLALDLWLIIFKYVTIFKVPFSSCNNKLIVGE